MTQRNAMVFAAILVAAGALALAGCGGDDGGLSAADMPRIGTAQTAAEAQTSDVVAAQAIARAQTADAVAARTAAETAQAVAEAQTAQATAARLAAGTSAAQAIVKKALAEAAEAAALADLAKVQDDLQAVEAALATANEARRTAETATAAAQSKIAAAKAAEAQAREAQATAEAARKDALAARERAAAAKVAAERALQALNTQVDELKDAAGPPYPTIGTLEDAADRQVAQRIDDFANTAEEEGPDGITGRSFSGIAIAPTLQGSATYTGAARGQWATRAAGTHLVDQGRFTATAEITANFNGPETVVSGVVSNFKDAARRLNIAHWRVKLEAGAMTARRVVVGATSGDPGITEWAGVWDARFLGNVRGNYPARITGRFQGETGTVQPVTTRQGLINLYRDIGFSGVVGSFTGHR